MIAEANASENPQSILQIFSCLLSIREQQVRHLKVKLFQTVKDVKISFMSIFLELYNYYPDTVTKLFKSTDIYNFGLLERYVEYLIKINELT